MEDAYRRLKQLLGSAPDWETLARFAPRAPESDAAARSGLASTLAASLELAREGRLQIRQLGALRPNLSPPEAGRAMIDSPDSSQPSEPTEDEERATRARRIMEAMIFAAGRPVDTAALAAQVPEGADVEDGLAALAAHYRHRGINLVKVAGGWTFRTAPDLAEHLTVHRVVRRRLSRGRAGDARDHRLPPTRDKGGGGGDSRRRPRARYARSAAGSGLDRAERASAHARSPNHMGHYPGISGAFRSRRPGRSPRHRRADGRRLAGERRSAGARDGRGARSIAA